MPDGIREWEEEWRKRTEPKEPDPFEEWVRATYDPGFYEHLQTLPIEMQQRYYDYFYRYVSERAEPLPRGRPQPEKYGLTENDWQTLMMLGENATRVLAELDKWVSTGYINEFQHRDIWEELSGRIRQATFEHLYGGVETAPEAIERRRKEEIARLKETGERGMAGIPKWQLAEWDERVRKGEITEEEVGRYIERREEAQEARTRRQKLARAWEYRPPQPEYARGFEEERAGVGGPQPWRDWFESQYPSLVGRFKAALPRMEQAAYPGLTPREAETQIEETWAETLRRRRPELREEYATRYPWGRYGRPGVMAPRIQTVSF